MYASSCDSNVFGSLSYGLRLSYFADILQKLEKYQTLSSKPQSLTYIPLKQQKLINSVTDLELNYIFAGVLARQ